MATPGNSTRPWDQLHSAITRVKSVCRNILINSKSIFDLSWHRPCQRWGSDSSGEKNNDLQDDICSENSSQTMVIEKPQDFRGRPRDPAGSHLSLTVLECDFSIQSLGDGFREGKTPLKRGPRPGSLFFSRMANLAEAGSVERG